MEPRVASNGQRIRRRGFFALGALVSAAFAAFAACGFPEPTSYGERPTSAEGAIDNEGGTSGPEDARILIDGVDPDALIVTDTGGPKVDAQACDPTECDCDKDGFRNIKKPNCEGGANDCDDSDPRAQPNQGFLLSKPEPPLFGDWNCSNTVERLYKEDFDCTKLAAGASTCDNAFGLTDHPGCGGFGTLVKCKTQPGLLGLGSTCVVAVSTTRTQQACK